MRVLQHHNQNKKTPRMLLSSQLQNGWTSLVAKVFTIVIMIAALLVVNVSATRVTDCSTGGAGAASPCCNLQNTFSSLDYLRYTNAQTAITVCALENQCQLCGTRSASDTESAARNQAILNAYLVFFERNQCWGGEIALSPSSTVTSLKNRNDYATTLFCGACSLSNFTSPCVSVGTCAGGFVMDWYLFFVVLESLAIVALLAVWYRAWIKAKAAASGGGMSYDQLHAGAMAPASYHT